MNKLIHNDYLRIPTGISKLIYWFSGMGVLGLIFLFIPWQQHISAIGRVSALHPKDRPQTVHAVVGGRIEEWFVFEGQSVKSGDAIVRISEIKDEYFDPQLASELERQISAKQSAIKAYQSNITALDKQIAALRDGAYLARQKMLVYFRQVALTIEADSISYEASKINEKIAKNQFERIEQLYKEGLKSLNEFQSFELGLRDAEAKKVMAHNKWMNSKLTLNNAEVELGAVEADYAQKLAKAEADKSKAITDLNTSIGELSKLEVYLRNFETRQDNYIIRAPQDGIVVKAIRQGLGEILKDGDPVVTIIATSPELAVELFVNAFDVPFVREGIKVRLEFNGFPAIQFAGFPELALGTFGGVIQNIDLVDSGNSTYRLLITPDPEDTPWPKLLRIGTDSSGWALLDIVPIWFEIWRNINAFPPNPPYLNDAKQANGNGKK